MLTAPLHGVTGGLGLFLHDHVAGISAKTVIDGGAVGDGDDGDGDGGGQPQQKNKRTKQQQQQRRRRQMVVVTVQPLLEIAMLVGGAAATVTVGVGEGAGRGGREASVSWRFSSNNSAGDVDNSGGGGGCGGGGGGGGERSCIKTTIFELNVTLPTTSDTNIVIIPIDSLNGAAAASGNSARIGIEKTFVVTAATEGCQMNMIWDLISTPTKEHQHQHQHQHQQQQQRGRQLEQQKSMGIVNATRVVGLRDELVLTMTKPGIFRFRAVSEAWQKTG